MLVLTSLADLLGERPELLRQMFEGMFKLESRQANAGGLDCAGRGLVGACSG